jgi:hypothetical protein
MFLQSACKESIRKGGIASGSVNTSDLIHNERNSIVAEFCRRVQSVVWGRRLFKTGKGSLGLATNVQAGDRVCVLYGLTVPVILSHNQKDDEKGDPIGQILKREAMDDAIESLKACIHRLEQILDRKKRYRKKKELDGKYEVAIRKAREDAIAYERTLKAAPGNHSSEDEGSRAAKESAASNPGASRESPKVPGPPRPGLTASTHGSQTLPRPDAGLTASVHGSQTLPSSDDRGPPAQTPRASQSTPQIEAAQESTSQPMDQKTDKKKRSRWERLRRRDKGKERALGEGAASPPEEEVRSVARGNASSVGSRAPSSPGSQSEVVQAAPLDDAGEGPHMERQAQTSQSGAQASPPSDGGDRQKALFEEDGVIGDDDSEWEEIPYKSPFPASKKRNNRYPKIKDKDEGEKVFYEFKGEAYVHGMMDGEALRSKFYWEIPDTLFEIR